MQNIIIVLGWGGGGEDKDHLKRPKTFTRVVDHNGSIWTLIVAYAWKKTRSD